MPGRLFPIKLEYVVSNPTAGQKQGSDTQGQQGSGQQGSGEQGSGQQGSGQQGSGRGQGNGGPGERGRGGKGSTSNAGLKKGSKDPSQDSIDPAPYLRLMQRIDAEVPTSQRGDMLVFVAGGLRHSLVVAVVWVRCVPTSQRGDMLVLFVAAGLQVWVDSGGFSTAAVLWGNLITGHCRPFRAGTCWRWCQVGRGTFGSGSCQ